MEIMVTLSEKEVRDALKDLELQKKSDPAATCIMLDLTDEVTLSITRTDDAFMKKFEDRKKNPLEA